MVMQSSSSRPVLITSDAERKINIGDLVVKSGVFSKKGVVTDINDENGWVSVDVSDEAINTYHRHAITTGMTLEEKNQFNDIMDSILTDSSDPKEQIKAIQDQIEELRGHEGSSQKVPQWLRNEQVKIIRQSSELPTVYTAERTALRY